MSLASLQFFVLFSISVGLYYVLPRQFRWCALLAFSAYFFLVSSEAYTGIYIITSIVSTWVCANNIQKAIEEKDHRKKKTYLYSGLGINIGILFLLKYTNFLIGNCNDVLLLFHAPGIVQQVDWAAPIGISYYTLQIIGYLLNVYWGITTADKECLKTALFVCYYPQLTSGPIARHEELRESLYSGHSFDWQNITYGFQRILWGIFKKLVISSRAGVIVDTIYSDTLRYDGFYIWVAAALFMLQLYTDFSGCMDIVIGASECYGIVLPENFRTPFFSKSVQEYWQRWHITLGAWLKDYILYPLLRTSRWRDLTIWLKKHASKKVAKMVPLYLGMLCVWFLIGLLHGGKWKYIIGTGIWFWLCIVLEQVCAPGFKKLTEYLRINTETFSWRLVQSLRVFVLVAVGNMFFRLKNLRTAIKTLFIGLSHWNPEILYDKSLYRLGINEKNFRVMMIGVLILLCVSLMQEKCSVRGWLSRQNIIFRWIVLFALIFSIIIYGQYGPGFDAQEFIYQGF